MAACTPCRNDMTPRPVAGSRLPGVTAASSTKANSVRSGQRRVQIGDTDVDIRDFQDECALQLRHSHAIVLLVTPLTGSVEVTTESGRYPLQQGSILLLARQEAATAVWRAGARGLVFHLPRAKLQALASAEFGEAHRLGGVTLELPGEAGEPGLRTVIERFNAHIGRVEPAGASRHVEASLFDAVIAALRAADEGRVLFPVARSVQSAIDYIHAHRFEPCGPEALAAVAGVTPETLRKNFRACLGVSIGQFVQNLRLDWARERLESGQESRAIHALAMEAGFGSSSLFSRTYRQRFGEIPSQTRARAVRTKTS
jgi:AraC-like DNA-binding protein